MKVLLVCVLGLLLGVSAYAQKKRPVSKVISLLKDMQAQLSKEQETDEGVYDKLQCWCETNDKEKSASIEEAQSKIAELTSTIEEATATISRLGTEIANLEKEIAANHDTLHQAAAIRAKENAAFTGEEKEMLEAVQALKAAITVLSKHHAPPAEALINIAAMLKHQMYKYKSVLHRALNSRQRRAMQVFMQQPFFGSKPTFKAGYEPQSNEIFGVLNSMKDEFEADLSDAQKDELRKQQAYDELKAAKEAEIAAASQAKNTKSEALADTQQKLAEAKQDMEDTRNSLSADQKYLLDLKLKCQQTDAEWAERQKTRGQELEAVSKAIAILSSDDAHDLFTRTFEAPASFVQKKSILSSKRRLAAAAVLKKAASKKNAVHASQLVSLATSVRLDAFTRVKNAIDTMVEQLKKEKSDEIVHKDWCVKEINGNERQTEIKVRDRSDLDIKMNTLNQQISSATKEIGVLTAEIADLQKQIQIAGEDREAENADFQATVRDAQETQKLLTQAVDVLKSFYAKSFTQTRTAQAPAGQVGPPPPEGFKSYQNQSASGGIVAMIEMIRKDAETMEKEAIGAEQTAQKAYEVFVQDSNASIETKQRKITNLSQVKATTEADLTQAKEDFAGVNSELQQLSAYAGQVHAACDFVLNNFDIRQAARDQETDALVQAKAILSGMSQS